MKTYVIGFSMIAAVLAFAPKGGAATISVQAIGSSNCYRPGYAQCDNARLDSVNDASAGSSYNGNYRNWFAFELPSFGSALESATISIWQPSNGYNSGDSNTVYQLYEGPQGDRDGGGCDPVNCPGPAPWGYTGYPYGFNAYDVFFPDGNNFDTPGTTLGSVTAADADTGSGTGHYVDITFNAAGLLALTGRADDLLVLAGYTSDGNAGFWGEQGANPTFLNLTFADMEAGPAAVPEPGSVLLMGTGLAALGAAIRRRRTAK